MDCLVVIEGSLFPRPSSEESSLFQYTTQATPSSPLVIRLAMCEAGARMRLEDSIGSRAKGIFSPSSMQQSPGIWFLSMFDPL